MMWTNGWSVGGWVLMALLMIVCWSLVIGGVIWLLRNSSRQQRPPAPGEPGAQQILDERFARGALTEVEYRQRRDLLHARGR